MKLYKSCGRYYTIKGCSWYFLAGCVWVYSEDGNDVNSYWHLPWREDLKLVGNNFRRK